MPAERFDFPNAQGQKLAALLDRPAGEPRAYALFAHCFTCGKDVRAAKRVAEGLTALGIAVLRSFRSAVLPHVGIFPRL